MIKVTRSACDGFRETKTFKTLNGARKYAENAVGRAPEFGRDYAVSFDGICTIHVREGCELRDLFPHVQG